MVPIVPVVAVVAVVRVVAVVAVVRVVAVVGVVAVCRRHVFVTVQCLINNLGFGPFNWVLGIPFRRIPTN